MDIEVSIESIPVKVLDGPYIEGGGPTEAAIRFATSLITQIGEIKRRVSSKLLTLYNEVWLDDGIGRLTAAEFQALLVDPEVKLYDEVGSAAVYFSDSEMFGGHTIEVWFVEEKIRDINLVG